MEDEAFELNLNWAKKTFFKNNFTGIFSIITFLSIIFSLSSLLGFSLQINFLVQIVSLFPSYIWFLLTLSTLISAVLAYHEKYSWMFLPIIIWLLFTTAVVRTSNISGLINAATGEPTLGPDLDPYLYLRNAIEISEGKNLGDLDVMRSSPIGAPSYLKSSMMPWAILFVQKIFNVFSNYSIVEAAIISPVIFFTISVLGFFLFVYFLFSMKLSKNKSLIGATIASLFYSFVPAMLHRTVAGIPEIESLGMMWFWFTFLFFVLAWKENLVEGRKFLFSNKKMIIYGLLAGLFAGAMSWTWGGYRYIYMILALSSFLAFLFNIDKKKNLVVFASFLVTGFLIEFLKVKSIFLIITNLTDTGFAFAVLIIMLINYFLFSTKLSKSLIVSRIKEKINLPESVLSIILFLIIGILFLLVINPSFLFNTFSTIVERLLYPFGRSRVGLTVAENRAPYFFEVLSNFGTIVWLFLAGTIISFYEAVKHFSQKKKIFLNTFFIIFVLTFVFSRISSDNLLNGDNFISKLLYFGGLILFGIALIWVYIQAYIKKNEKILSDFSLINFASILLISFSFWGIVSMRGAVRLFFIIAPIIILVASYFFVKIFDYRKSKEDLNRMFVWIMIIVASFVIISTFIFYAGVTTAGAKQVIPSSYNQQWNYAMDWVTKNTPESSVFVHWWDYGYWVQSIGERPTVTDGGHYVGWWDHTTARYLLTTSKPETALSLMKTHNVSYLLIDSTDVGKYPAFSGIGSNESGTDRLSWIPVMPLDSSQTQEVNGTINAIYSGGQATDADIVYGGENGSPLFLPGGKVGLAGIIIRYSQNEGEFTFSQPVGVFVYNGKRYDLPLRYIFTNGETLDFGKGVNSLVMFVPSLDQGSSGFSINPVGSVIYLSEKTKDTLFSQLYLMNDPKNIYPTINIAHSEDDPVIKSLKSQGVAIGDFIYYQGLRGPIKIWEVGYPDNVIEREEFLFEIDPNENWGLLDNLNFTK